MRVVAVGTLLFCLVAVSVDAQEHPTAKAGEQPKGEQPKRESKKEQSLDQILQEAASAGERPRASDEAAAVEKQPAEPARATEKPATTAARTDAAAARATDARPAAAASAAQAAPITDDNDTT